jgi:hypothetical protein
MVGLTVGGRAVGVPMGVQFGTHAMGRPIRPLCGGDHDDRTRDGKWQNEAERQPEGCCRCAYMQ